MRILNTQYSIHNTQTTETINKYVEIIANKLGNNLEALILVGSFARGEGLTYQNNGKLELMSDIEFWGVVKNLSTAKSIGIEGEKLTIGFTTRKHLARLKPYIFTVEAKKFGKVLWGDKSVPGLIPSYSFEDIEPVDGFILLNNRIVEQLILFNKIQNNGSVQQYDFDKGYIQLVNSYLAFNKRYRSLYPEKKEEFFKLYKDKNTNLAQKVHEAFESLKANSANYIPNDKAIKEWQELRTHYKEIWLCESVYVGLPKVRDRIRGWLKVLGNVNKRRLFSISEVAVNFFRISPQFLIYCDAASLYFSDYIDMVNLEKIVKKWKIIVK